MDRQSISSPVYNHDDEFDVMKNLIDAKMDKHMEELKVLINNCKRYSSASRRRSRAKTPKLPSPASTHKQRHRQDHEERPSRRELASLPAPCTRASNPRAHGTLCARPSAPPRAWAIQNRDIETKATASSTTLASSPHDFKASSPSDVRHLRLLHELKSTTSTSYFDFTVKDEIPFFGTHELEEYLEWEHKMDDYLKLHQAPSEDQVKCTASTFHDYALTWWLHTPSRSLNMSWSNTKKATRREFVPSTYMDYLLRQLENTIQGSKSLDEYFKNMKEALRRASVDDRIWMKVYFMMGLNNNIAKPIFTNNYESLDDMYFGALKAEQELMKAKSTRPQAHFATTTL
ncbi:uncharacterized protein [Aegilops tauschii subsp. strangulata]|uniref:uncharacterized protein n=1 Tax=Aegilops tauschii subsp. strangulata TaxID=200361 RepID=UPI001ABC09D4